MFILFLHMHVGLQRFNVCRSAERGGEGGGGGARGGRRVHMHIQMYVHVHMHTYELMHTRVYIANATACTFTRMHIENVCTFT